MTPIEARLLVGQSRSPERKRLSQDGKTWEPLTEAEQAMVDVSTDPQWMKRQLRKRYRPGGWTATRLNSTTSFVDPDFDEDM